MPSKLGDAAVREGRALAGVFFTDFGVALTVTAFFVDFGVFLGLTAFFADFGVLFGLAAFLVDLGVFWGLFVTDLGAVLELSETRALFTSTGVFINSDTPSKFGVAALTEGCAFAGVFFAGLFLADFGVFFGLAPFLADFGVFLGLTAFLVDFGVFFGLAAFLVDLGVFWGLFVTDLGVVMELSDKTAFFTFSATTGVFNNSDKPSKFGVAALREG